MSNLPPSSKLRRAGKTTTQKSKLKNLMTIKNFDGKKIIVRSLTAKDLKTPEKFRDFINSLVREQAMILINTPKTKKDELDWLKDSLREIRKSKGVRLVAESNGKIVGNTGITLLKESKNHVGELGISIRNGYRGIGLGKSLMAEIINLAKKKFGKRLKIIRLSVHQDNQPAFNLYQKMGFQLVAKIPKQVQRKGGLIDELIMLKYI